jgi:hypothetical protein
MEFRTNRPDLATKSWSKMAPKSPRVRKFKPQNSRLSPKISKLPKFQGNQKTVSPNFQPKFPPIQPLCIKEAWLFLRSICKGLGH